MKVSLEHLHREIGGAVIKMETAAAAGDWGTALAQCRIVLSAGSRLFSRLSLLTELQADADFVADAMGHAPHPGKGTPQPIPGEQPLPFPKNGTPRKPRGKKEGG